MPARPAISMPGPAGAALHAVIATGAPRLRFAVTHPYSGHNYELRYWLAASGIAPDRDIDIAILPPPLMADALAAGTIDGYCVGEPWNSVGVAAGAGRIVTVKARLWTNSPDKVLGASARWADPEPGGACRLVAGALRGLDLVRRSGQSRRGRRDPWRAGLSRPAVRTAVAGAVAEPS